MYIVNLIYVKPLTEIEEHIRLHREFLDVYYAKDIFLASGPKNPRDGGIILASGKVSRTELDNILAEDPFQQHGLARYDITEFEPNKHHGALSGIL
ncbi:GTP cyclohydrolase [Phyllobacterium phragmitis]|uniref:GTP cyclohydrolase n=1 Tax=Phyllobacterium phragmitis TaxID=2670329 RepID=A0A2S9IZA8_9HYPH|nr:YciI family protein [Phyllobacterium phragmitis]PRD45871.1 GTP cyclohydrolase [Phyllobacterium phragmitis]